MSADPELDLARSDAADACNAWREQWVKFNKAVESGVTGAPLVQIDRKLTRLQYEMEKAGDRVRELERRAPLGIVCPSCGAGVGQRCIRPLAVNPHMQHRERWALYYRTYGARS